MYDYLLSWQENSPRIEKQEHLAIQQNNAQALFFFFHRKKGTRRAEEGAEGGRSV